MRTAGAFEYESPSKSKGIVSEIPDNSGPIDMVGEDSKVDMQGIGVSESEGVYHLLMLGSPGAGGKADTSIMYIQVLTAPEGSSLLGRIMPLDMEDYKEIRGPARPTEDSFLNIRDLSKRQRAQLRSYTAHHELKAIYDEFQDLRNSRRA